MLRQMKLRMSIQHQKRRICDLWVQSNERPKDSICQSCAHCGWNLRSRRPICYDDHKDLWRSIHRASLIRVLATCGEIYIGLLVQISCFHRRNNAPRSHRNYSATRASDLKINRSPVKDIPYTTSIKATIWASRGLWVRKLEWNLRLRRIRCRT